MGLQIIDYSKAPLLDSPAKSIFEDVLKGYKMSQEPGKMKQEATARELANNLSELDLQHKPKKYEQSEKLGDLTNKMKAKALEHYDEKFNLYRDLTNAQINKANRPAQIGGAFSQALQLRNQYPVGSKERELVDSYINKLSTSKNGIQVSNTPEGGINVSIGGQAETASIPGLPAIKKGETYLYDKDNKPIGIGKPYTAAQEKEASGRASFNIYQKFITDAQKPYSGKGATRQFENDVKAYNTDEAARNRIDNLLAADKLIFSATVKEEATLGGANTNQAYNRITHSLENSEIYPSLKKIAKYQLPKGYQAASSEIFNQKLNEGTEAGQNIPAYKPYYFQQQNNSGKKPPSDSALKTSLENNNPKRFKSGFKTETEFNNYYLSLSPEDRKAYREQLGGKNG